MKAGPVPYTRWLKKYLRGPQWPQQGTLVAIGWQDATMAEDIEQSGTIRAVTVGIVVEATPDHIKTASEFFEDLSVRDVTTIPAGMVHDIHPYGIINLQVAPGPLPKPKARR